MEKSRMGKWNCIKVRCVETGQEWESRRACSREVGCCDVTISNCIKFGDAYKGRHYVNA